MHPICVSLRRSLCLSSPFRSSALTNAFRILSPASAAGLGMRELGNAGVRARGGTCSGLRGLSVARFCLSGDMVLMEGARERVPKEDEEGGDAAHVPVLLKEVIGSFEGRRLLNYMDCTLGAGGHACAVEGVIVVDGAVLSPGLRSHSPSSFGILSPSHYREQLYRPSGLSVLLNSSSAIFEKQFKCSQKQSRVRGFAKTVQVPQSMQKPMKLKLYMGSPGVIGEPYKPPPPPLPLLRRWFTREGWSRRKQSFMGMIKTSYTIAKLRQKTKGYSQQRFYQEVSDLYKQINSALAEGQRTALRHLVTDSVFSIMKNELKHRENSTWAKVDWEMVGSVTKMRTLQGRLIGVDKNNHDNAFVQLTVRINSKQKFAAYDKRGKLVAGDPDKELLVEDIWVFEKPLLLTEAKWRLCARLSV